MAEFDQRVPVWVFVLLGFVGLSLMTLFIVPVLLESREEEAQRAIREQLEPALDYVERLQIALARDALNERGYLLTGDSVYLRRVDRMVAEQREALSGLHMLVPPMSSEADSALATLDESLGTWHENREQVLADFSDAADAEAFPFLASGYNASLYAAERLNAAIEDAAAERREALQADKNSWTMALAGLALLALVSVALLVWFGRYLHRLSEERRKAVKTRDKLLATVSHDLRAPLQTTLAVHDMLATRSADDEKGRSFLEMARQSIRHMQQMVDGLLDATMIEQGRLTLNRSRVEIESFLEEVRDTADVLAGNVRVQLQVANPPRIAPIQADPDRLKEVFFNLVSNAAEATPEGNAITIGATVEGEVVRFFVEDTGAGMDEERLESLFESSGPDDPDVDHGLGLMIARSIVEAHGGEIWAESEPGVGSTFTFSIPVDDDDRTRAPNSDRAREHAM